MRKWHKQLELEKIINASGVFKSLESLERQLENYQSLEGVMKSRYQIKHEVSALNIHIKSIRTQLMELLQSAEKWEALE